MEPLQGHALDIWIRLHAFFLAFDGVFVDEPGYVLRANGGFYSEGDFEAGLMELGLALHSIFSL